MPCATNIKAAFDLGLGLSIVSFLSCSTGDLFDVINGVAHGVINWFLIFGAYKRQSTAILIWIVFAVISCIGYAIMVVILIATAAGTEAESKEQRGEN